MDLEGVTIRRREDLERTGNWLLVRRSLGVDSFGINLVEIPPGERIPEHDETGRDQEEVFLVLEGSPSLVVDGREIETPAGTFARPGPHPLPPGGKPRPAPPAGLVPSAPRANGHRPPGGAGGR